MLPVFNCKVSEANRYHETYRRASQFEFTFPNLGTKGARDLISRLLKPSPIHRPILSQVLEHPRVSGRSTQALQLSKEPSSNNRPHSTGMIKPGLLYSLYARKMLQVFLLLNTIGNTCDWTCGATTSQLGSSVSEDMTFRGQSHLGAA